jgi:Tfp pilus assembly protein PilO
MKEKFYEILKKCVVLKPHLRIAVIFLFVMVIFIFFKFFIYSVLDEDKNKHINLLNNISSKISQKILNQSTYGKKRAIYSSLENMNAQKMTDLFKLMDEAAQKNGIHLYAIKPSKSEQQDGMHVSHYDLHASGEYLGLMNFLKALSEAPWVIVFSSVILSSMEPAMGANNDLLQLSLDMHIYREKE